MSANRYGKYIHTHLLDLASGGSRARIFRKDRLTPDISDDFNIDGPLIRAFCDELYKNLSTISFTEASIEWLQKAFQQMTHNFMQDLKQDKSWQEKIPAAELNTCINDLNKAFVFFVISICYQEDFSDKFGAEAANKLQSLLQEVNKRTFTDAKYDNKTDTYVLTAPGLIKQSIEQKAKEEDAKESGDLEYKLMTFLFSNTTLWEMISNISKLMQQLEKIKSAILKGNEHQELLEQVQNDIDKLTTLVSEIYESVHQAKGWTSEQSILEKISKTVSDKNNEVTTDFSKVQKNLESMLKEIAKKTKRQRSPSFTKNQKINSDKSDELRKFRTGTLMPELQEVNSADGFNTNGEGSFPSVDDPAAKYQRLNLKGINLQNPDEKQEGLRILAQTYQLPDSSTTIDPFQLTQNVEQSVSPRSPRQVGSEEALKLLSERYANGGHGSIANAYKTQGLFQPEASVTQLIKDALDMITFMSPQRTRQSSPSMV